MAEVNPNLPRKNLKVSYQYLFLLFVTAIAAGLRLYRLGEWSMWIEEHHSLRHALNADFSLEALISNRMPFYLVLKVILGQLGVNEWTARLVPAIVGIATVPILFLVIRRLFCFRVALLASTLLALSPWHIYWSQNVRFYSLLLLTYSVSLFSFYWGIEKDRMRYILLSVVGLAASGVLHLVSALLIPVFILYYLSLKLLPWEKPAGLRFRNLIPLVGLPVIGFAVLEAVTVFFLDGKPFSYVFYARNVDPDTASFTGLSGPYAMLTAVVYYVGTPVALLGLVGSVHLFRNKERAGLLLTIGALLPLVSLMLLTTFASTSSRYAFMTLACWVILAAAALRAVQTQWGTRTAGILLILAGIAVLLPRDPVVEDLAYYSSREPVFRLLFLVLSGAALLGLLVLSRAVRSSTTAWIGGSLIVLLALVHPLGATTMYYRFQHGHRADLRAAAAAILQGRAEGEPVFAAPPSPLDYYLGQDVIHPKLVDINELLGSGKRFWLLESQGLNESFKRKVTTNCRCQMRANLDVYTAGREWKARVYHCEPKREAHTDSILRKSESKGGGNINISGKKSSRRHGIESSGEWQVASGEWRLCPYGPDLLAAASVREQKKKGRLKESKRPHALRRGLRPPPNERSRRPVSRVTRQATVA